MRQSLPALLLSILAFSGCLGVGLTDPVPAPTTPLAPAEELISPQMLKVRGLLANTTCEPSAPASATSKNLKLLSTFRTPGNLYTPAPLLGQIDTYQNRTAYVAVNGNFIAVVNTTDPTKPVLWTNPNIFLLAGGNILADPRSLTPFTNTWDVRFNSDGSDVIVAINNRLYVVDITTRIARPTPGGFLDMPPDYGGQAYRLASQVIDRAEYVFVAPGPTGAGLFVARLSGTGYYAKIDAIGMMPTPGGQAGRINLQPYDMRATTEWVNGGNHTLLYLANGPHGVLVLDVTNPTKPEVATSLPAPTPGPNNLPSAYTSIEVAHVEGKRLLIASQTGGQNLVRVWDLADFRSPKPLATWSLPGQAAPLQPQGELAVANSTLFITHREHGLYGVDLAALVLNGKDGLKAVLHYQPAAGSIISDVTIEDGLIHLADSTQPALQILGYGCFQAGDRRLTSAS